MAAWCGWGTYIIPLGALGGASLVDGHYGRQGAVVVVGVPLSLANRASASTSTSASDATDDASDGGVHVSVPCIQGPATAQQACILGHVGHLKVLPVQLRGTEGQDMQLDTAFLWQVVRGGGCVCVPLLVELYKSAWVGLVPLYGGRHVGRPLVVVAVGLGCIMPDLGQVLALLRHLDSGTGHALQLCIGSSSRCSWRGGSSRSNVFALRVPGTITRRGCVFVV